MAPDTPGEGGRRAAALSTSFSHSPIVDEAIARDVAACADDDDLLADSASESSQDVPEPTLYRRPSGVAYGPARPLVNDLSGDAGVLSAVERVRSRGAERDLLRDNHILPEPPRPGASFLSRAYRRVFGGGSGDGKPAGDRETEPLLAGGPEYDDVEVNQQWNEAVAAGKGKTSWGREVKTVGGYAAPLLLALLLQYSVNVVCIFAVGKIGKMELGAVSRTSPLLPSHTLTALGRGSAPDLRPS